MLHETPTKDMRKRVVKCPVSLPARAVDFPKRQAELAITEITIHKVLPVRCSDSKRQPHMFRTESRQLCHEALFVMRKVGVHQRPSELFCLSGVCIISDCADAEC